MIRFLFVFLPTVLLITNLCYSQIDFERDSSEVFKTILKIDRFDDDQTLDTLIGYGKSNGSYYPRLIVWGEDATENGIPDELRVDTTEIEYPKDTLTGTNSIWEDVTCRPSFYDINGDTLCDIIMFNWAFLRVDSTSGSDTARAVVIFGQKGLDTLYKIKPWEIDTFQIRPYVAMDLRLSKELTNCKVRDLSEIPSYEVNEIELDTEDTTHIPPPLVPLAVTDLDQPEIRIFPNPAKTYINVNIENLQAGVYQIEIIDLQGNTAILQSLEIAGSQSLDKAIDIGQLASGLYYLRLRDEKELIGIFNLIIIK